MLTSPTHTPPAASTAVLVFARGAEAEARHRFRGTRPGLRRALCRGLRRQTLATAAASGLPVVLASEREQRGRTESERLANACADALALGYERLIVVGGDCPGLRAQHLRAAATALASGRTVLGRDLRGGVYLFGFCARANAEGVPGFDASLLRDLPFGTPRFAAALVEAMARDGRAAPVALASLGDVHDHADLLRERPRVRNAGLREAVRAATAAFAKTTLASPPNVARELWLRTVVGHRGPPRTLAAAR